MGANRRSKDGGDLGLPGYEVLDRLYASEQTAVFRAVRVADHCPVILKTRMPERVTSAGLGRCRYEYEVIRRLDAPGITKAHDLVPFDGSLVLVLEDCGGESLGRLLRGWKRAGAGAFSVPDFYLLADKLLRGLAAIHGAGIVHKDICPSNIVYNPTTGELRIIDFDIAAVLDRERPLLRSPHSLEGTLAYLSPEQTGRVNRTVDYRSDYYSLGVTFYELLTGTLPFEGADAIEIVHHHIASTPVEPRSRNPLIPEPLSSLVLKLMAKAPEDRYQSAYGIRSDLEALSRRWRDREVDSAFKLGRHDRAERFTIPEKLHGRQHHVRALLAAFEAVAEGEARLVMVSGSSGIGKTSVVNEIHRPILRRRGYFVRGKFDALGRGVPFSAITQAMRELVEQLLGETPARLARQKADILGALGDSAQAILDVVPELERVIGPQPEVPALSADAARNRFTLLFGRFADAIATADHPLVLFLDDLQWADAASLEITRILISERPAGHLLDRRRVQGQRGDTGPSRASAVGGPGTGAGAPSVHPPRSSAARGCHAARRRRPGVLDGPRATPCRARAPEDRRESVLRSPVPGVPVQGEAHRVGRGVGILAMRHCPRQRPGALRGCRRADVAATAEAARRDAGGPRACGVHRGHLRPRDPRGRPPAIANGDGR